MSSLPRATAGYIRANYDDLVQLPAPPEEFSWAVIDLDRNEHSPQKLKRLGIIHQTRSRPRHSNNYYVVDERAWNRIQSYL